MRKSGWYQGFWKSAKTENQIHGRAALDGAGDTRRWDFHEDALFYFVTLSVLTIWELTVRGGDITLGNG